MSWIILLIAGLLEVVWAVGLKYTHGFSRLTPSIITIAAMIVSMALLAWVPRMPCGQGLALSVPPSPVFCCWVNRPIPCVWPVWR